MQFLNSLLLITSILFIIPHCQGNCDDEPPCTNDELYGEGKMCYFSFLGDISPKNMKRWLTADATLYLKGCLHDFTIDFAVSSHHPDLPWITLVQEKGKVVWGYTYLMPVDTYQSEVLPKIEWEGKVKILRSQKMKIEVTIEGKKQNIDCNALVAVNQPKKESCIPPERQPKESCIDDMVNMCTAAHFPSDYIEEVRNIPQRFCKCK